jgi:hypothetical protein
MAEDSRSIHPNALVNYQGAVIPREKLEKYVLDPTHEVGKHKALVFQSVLGFDQSNWEILKQRILDELPYHEAVPSGEGLWGKKFVARLPITGVNGHTAEVETVWIIRPRTDYPGLVTALVLKRKR